MHQYFKENIEPANNRLGEMIDKTPTTAIEARIRLKEQDMRLRSELKETIVELGALLWQKGTLDGEIAAAKEHMAELNDLLHGSSTTPDIDRDYPELGDRD